jgi:nicotinamidase-related amidase
MEQNTKNTALLIMDMQSAILRNLLDSAQIISNAAKAIAYARSSKIPVIYVRVGFRAGAPEINKNNKAFSSYNMEKWTSANMEDWKKIHLDLAPIADEIIVTKRRLSAFTGSDLEVVLRAMDIKHIILAGVSTSGVVLSTLREAADKDYRITVLSDCCADRDEEVHRVLITKIFPRHTDVLAVDEWIVSLNK